MNPLDTLSAAGISAALMLTALWQRPSIELWVSSWVNDGAASRAGCAVVDRPSDHEIEAADGFGAVDRVGTAKNTLLTVSTGCHLPQGGLG